MRLLAALWILLVGSRTDIQIGVVCLLIFWKWIDE